MSLQNIPAQEEHSPRAVSETPDSRWTHSTIAGTNFASQSQLSGYFRNSVGNYSSSWNCSALFELAKLKQRFWKRICQIALKFFSTFSPFF